MITHALPSAHTWLRLTQPHYEDPFDTTFAQQRGGRWNPPTSWPTLYLNEDLATAHAQVRHLFVGRGIEPDDLGDDAPIMLAAAKLPERQQAADVFTSAGLAAAGLDSGHPLARDGVPIQRDITQAIGAEVHGAGLGGVRCRSATGAGCELAWFPAAAANVRPVWARPLPYGAWRYARTLADLGLSG